jgi:hypothetical protein
VAGEPFVNEFEDDRFELLQNAGPKLRFLLNELSEGARLLLARINELLQQKVIIAVQPKHHLTFLSISALAVDILDNLRSVGVQNELLDLVLDCGPDERFLRGLRRIVKCLGSQVMAVLASHHSGEERFDFVDNEGALGLVSELHEGLEHAAPVMLVAKLGVLVSDKLDAFLDGFVLFSVADFLLLHHELVVINAQGFNQVGYLLLLATV